LSIENSFVIVFVDIVLFGLWRNWAPDVIRCALDVGAAMWISQHFADVPEAARRCVVAIGNFDGVHRGHQKLLAVARARAAELNAYPVVLTFDPHPRRVFNPGIAPQKLMPALVKLEAIARYGIAGALVQHFDRHFASLTAEEFIAAVLVGALGVSHVVVGEDYRFGARRTGDVDLLCRLGRTRSFGVTAVEPVRDAGGHIISSSRVRCALREGRITDATEMLGRHWEIMGQAQRRDGVLAIPLGDLQRPGPGMYDVQITGDQGPRTQWDGALRSVAGFPVAVGAAGDMLHVPTPPHCFSDRAVRIRLLDRFQSGLSSADVEHLPSHEHAA